MLSSCVLLVGIILLRIFSLCVLYIGIVVLCISFLMYYEQVNVILCTIPCSYIHTHTLYYTFLYYILPYRDMVQPLAFLSSVHSLLDSFSLIFKFMLTLVYDFLALLPTKIGFSVGI